MGRLTASLRRILLAPLVSAAVETAVADTGVERTFLERAAISAADDACRLFTPAERLALNSGFWQSRGELLRNGRTPEEVDRLAADVASHARSLGCRHASVVEVAATVRDSYSQFAKISYMPYPAAHAVWEASRSRHDQWSVKQSDRGGVVFGLRRINEPAGVQLAVAIPAGNEPPPASAQLLMRNPDKLSQPWLGGVLDRGADRLVLAPRSMLTPQWASRLSHEKDFLGQPVHVFYFSAAAQAHLESLDPREAVAIDLLPVGRDASARPRRILFEVGDIRAARAFSEIPQPVYPPPK